MAKNMILRKLALPPQEWQSILKGAGLAVLGALVTYMSQNLTNVDFGQYTYIIVPAVTIVLNLLRKFVLHEPTIIGSMSEGETKELPKD